MEKQPKRDFLFIDESGDPGLFTDYYIVGILHVTDVDIKKLNVDLGAFRYFGNVNAELKSGSTKPFRKERLLQILKNSDAKMSASYIIKSEYEGPFLGKESNKFRHYILRQAIFEHFKVYNAESNEIEVIIDRFENEHFESTLRSYLRVNKFNPLPSLLHIIMADSRYVDLLQVADWVAGCVKDKFFKNTKTDTSNIHIVKIND
jgi:hypothetical protein